MFGIGVGLRTRLSVLVAVGVLPLLLFSGALVFDRVQQERRTVEAQAAGRLEALLAAVDREIRTAQTDLQLLASSPDLRTQDFQAFHRQLVEAVKSRGVGIVLLDRSGQQLVHTNVGWGDPLPRRTELSALTRVFETGQPQVSDLVMGATLRRPIVSVEVPVHLDGEVRWALAMGLSPATLSRLLLDQKYPASWVAAVFDRRGITVARTRAADEFIGKPASPMLLERLSHNLEGWFTTITNDGEEVYTLHRRSPVTEWQVALGIPSAEVDDPVRNTLLLLVAIGGLLLLGSLLAARLATQALARRIDALGKAALAVGSGKRPELPQRGVPELDRAGAALMTAADLLEERSRRRDAAEAALRESEQRLAATYSRAPVGIGETDLDGRFIRVNPELCEITGLGEDELLGRSFVDITHVEDRAAASEQFRTLLAGRLASYVLDKRLVRKDGRAVWTSVTCSLVRDEAGTPSYAIRVVQNIDERKRSEERQALLVAELDHRVKNTLANIISLAQQSSLSAGSVSDFVASLQQRLMAIARTHEALTRERFSGVSLRRLVEQETAPWRQAGRENIHLQTGDVWLKPAAAQTLCLALHELATNAAKHGALSSPHGTIALSCQIEERDGKTWASLTWRETGGPPVTPPHRRGFGRHLLERIVAFALEGEARLDFAMEGLCYRASFPLERMAETGRAAE